MQGIVKNSIRDIHKVSGFSQDTGVSLVIDHSWCRCKIDFVLDRDPYRTSLGLGIGTSAMVKVDGSVILYDAREKGSDCGSVENMRSEVIIEDDN